MRLARLLCLLAAFFLEVTYAAKLPEKTPPVFDESHVSILVTADQTQFLIQLNANPSTGYSWFLRDYDDRLITPTQYRFEPAKNKLVGAPGVAVWTFTVKNRK